jgi:glycosyltransferase involved in cell wall biosynthesis
MKESFDKNQNLHNSQVLTEKVSIVIPFYNCKYVDRAITSALTQSYKNIEVIVVDDGSTIYVDKITPFLKDIIYIKKNNGGTATALNEGIKRASGDYFVWLSSDDELHPSKVALQLEFIKKNKATISYTNFIWINSLNRQISSPINTNLDKISFYRSLKSGCPINGSTIMIKLDLFQNVGLFDESLIYAHDYDLWIRIVLKYEILFLDQPLTYYRVHRKMGTRKHLPEIENEALTIQNRYGQKLDELIAKVEGSL